jgi:hypothetical protein
VSGGTDRPTWVVRGVGEWTPLGLVVERGRSPVAITSLRGGALSVF